MGRRNRPHELYRGAGGHHGVHRPTEEHDRAGLMVVSPTEECIGLSQMGAPVWGKEYLSSAAEKNVDKWIH